MAAPNNQHSDSERSEEPPAYEHIDGNLLQVKFSVDEIWTPAELRSDLHSGPRHQDRSSWIDKIGKASRSQDKIVVRMRIDEYLRYFVKSNRTGDYKEGVVEPPGGRRNWLKQRLHEQEETPRSVLVSQEQEPVNSVDELKGNTVFL